MSELVYDVIVASPLGEAQFSLEHAQWMVDFRPLLDTATTITLVPHGFDLPTVVMHYTPEQRWILFTRVFGVLGQTRQVRLYCLGQQQTLAGQNNKHLLWVYPNGVIEAGLEPAYWRYFI